MTEARTRRSFRISNRVEISTCDGDCGTETGFRRFSLPEGSLAFRERRVPGRVANVNLRRTKKSFNLRVGVPEPFGKVSVFAGEMRGYPAPSIIIVFDVCIDLPEDAFCLFSSEPFIFNALAGWTVGFVGRRTTSTRIPTMSQINAIGAPGAGGGRKEANFPER